MSYPGGKTSMPRQRPFHFLTASSKSEVMLKTPILEKFPVFRVL